jgi:hypothetical protein
MLKGSLRDVDVKGLMYCRQGTVTASNTLVCMFVLHNAAPIFALCEVSGRNFKCFEKKEITYKDRKSQVTRNHPLIYVQLRNKAISVVYVR